MADDPGRRSQAAHAADQRAGYLFGPGPGQRRLRTLLDLDTLSEDTAGTSAWDQLQRLAGFGHIDLWWVSLSRVQPGPKRAERGVVYLHDLPEVGGWSAVRGSQFRWALQEKNTERSGFVRVKPAPPQPESGRAVGADIVVSCAPTVGRADLEVNYETNFFTPQQAVGVMAHYLRTQHIFPCPAVAPARAGTTSTSPRSGRSRRVCSTGGPNARVTVRTRPPARK
ncbi:hypothetical protein [Nocardia carnea]|uniref:hypothetical protein n=1 Tax=Nocardia carnea TaxID=37328 RepID=UPI002455B12A|nr:hypothetical protein [Nocardia carnea]